jgi:hypothetical protein
MIIPYYIGYNYFVSSQYIYCHLYLRLKIYTLDLEHLHQRSVCDSALEILDEVHELNPVNDSWDPEIHSFQSPGGTLERSNKPQPNHCSMFLIG